MLEAFRQAFGPIDDDGREVTIPTLGDKAELNTQELRRHYGGRFFRRGLYRVVDEAEKLAWNARVEAAFPEFAYDVDCFAYDWLGRAFVLRTSRSVKDTVQILMLEPGTGLVLEIPGDLIQFHDEELVQYPDAALASEFHAAWLNGGGAVPSFGECVGYKVPLFLAGADEITNLDVADVDVYWHLLGQLRKQTKDLPPGTKVNVGIGH